MEETLVVNLYGAPGSGKSTGAAYIFAKLKMLGINCELITEFAKDKVWENNLEVFNNQLYILGKQSFKISRVLGKVDVIITDAPLYNNMLYLPKEQEHLFDAYKKIISDFSSKYDNFHYYIERVKPYNPNGRHQTEEESDKIGKKFKEKLLKNSIPIYSVNGDINGYDSIIENIVNHFKN